MKEKRMIKNLLLILVAVFIVMCLNINLEYCALEEVFNGNSVLYIIYGIFTYKMLEEVIQIKDKRAKICCIILGIIFGLCEVLGYSIMQTNSLSLVLGSKLAILKSFFKLIGYITIFYSILLLLFTKMIPSIKEKFSKKEEWKYFTNSKKSFLLTTVLILVAYLPYFLHEYPGFISTDTISEMATGLYSMDYIVNHHPVFHIVLISIAMNFGKLIGNYNLAVGVFSICQMIFIAITFSFVLYYMSKKKVHRYIRVIALLFFMFYQPFAMYSITLWKDIPFSIMIVWLTIGMIEIATNKAFYSKSKNMILVFLAAVFVILFKNNGFYIVLICIPFIIIASKENRKKATVLSIAILLFYIVLKGPIFSMFGIHEGPIREALSIPCQQIARVVRDEQISEYDRQRINQFLPVEEIGEAYYPLISDSVKDKLNNEKVKENKTEFIKLWVELFFKYPKTYIEAFLNGSYGYWYPEAYNWVIWGGYNEESWEWARTALQIDISKEPIVENRGIEILKSLAGRREVPILGMIYSIGFIAWVELIGMTYLIYKKQYKLLLAFVPILGVWLTCIASPVWCEYRYSYGLFTCLPLIIAISITQSEKEEKEGTK